MFSRFEPYYNESIRKTIIAFGSLFNQIYFNRKDSSGNVIETSRVPLTYSPKEKFIQLLKSESGITDNTHIKTTLPRMGFEITGFLYDSQRKLNRLQTKLRNTNNTNYSSFIEVPYIVNVGMYLFCRNLDDNLQIVEQILPFFAPDFTVHVNMNELNPRVAVPIILNNTSIVEDYEGDFETRRSVNTVFDFTIKTYVYGPIRTQDTILIEDVNIELFEGLTADNNYRIFSIGYTGDSETRSGINYYEL